MTFTPTDTLLLNALLPTAPNQQRLRELRAGKTSEINWGKAVQKSLAGGTAALLRHNLASASVLEFIPKTEQRLLAKESHSWAARQQIYVTETTHLLKAFQSHGINALPLKGAALMLGAYYPLPGLRAAVDVDLLVVPEQVDAAFAFALNDGFARVEIKKSERAPIPLPYELRHLPLLRNQRGIALELHYRAFHDLRHNRDFGWAEMIERAVERNGVLLPAAEDLALHLIQHTIVDLTSAYAILRTLADVHFLLAAEPRAREQLVARAEEFALRDAVALTLATLQTLEEGNHTQVNAAVGLLLKTALSESMSGTIEAARLFEYLDLRQQPRARLKHLYALLTASEKQIAAQQPAPHKLTRVLSLLRRFNWQGVTLADLRRVLALRKITQRK